MRKIVLAALIAVSTNALATGIPVVDVVGNMNMVREIAQQAQQFQQTIEQARSQANHYKSMVEGSTNWYQSSIDGGNLNDILSSDWKQFYDGISGSKLTLLRSKYNMISSQGVDSPEQKIMDTKLKELAIQDEMYSRSLKRNQRLDRLKTQLSSADTPQSRESLMSAIQLESMQMQNDQQLLSAMTSMQHANAEQERREAYKQKIHNLYTRPSNH